MQTTREHIGLAAGQTYRLLRWTQSVTRVDVVSGPGRSTPMAGHGDHWHYHPETELTLIERGTGTRFVADQIELFEPGDLVLIGANVPHYWHFRGPSSGLSLQWDFPMEHGIWNFAEATLPLRRLAESAQRGLCLTGKTAETIRGLLRELPALAGMRRLTEFLQLVSVVATAGSRDIRPLARRPFSMTGTMEQQDAIRRAVSYIIAHYRETVALPDLLRLTGMSRATFARQFHRHAGKSFSTFLNQVRLRAVCRALSETSESVSAIAFSHGFNQLSFFNRLFRRELRMNPSEWRQNQSDTSGAAAKRED